MKIFNDYKAKQKFIDIYDMLDEPEKSAFAEEIRKAAKAKIESLNDNLTDFYLTEKDIENCFNDMPTRFSPFTPRKPRR